MNNNKLKFVEVKNQDRVKLAIFRFEDIDTNNIVEIKMTDLLNTHNKLLENMIKQEIQKSSSERLRLSDIYEFCYQALGDIYSIYDIKNVLIKSQSIYYFAKVDIKIFTMIKDLLNNHSDIFNNEEKEIALNILKNKYSEEEKVQDEIIKSIISKMHDIELQTKPINLINLDLNSFNFKNMTDEQIESGYLILQKVPLDYSVSDYPYELNRFEIKK